MVLRVSGRKGNIFHNYVFNTLLFFSSSPSSLLAFFVPLFHALGMAFHSLRLYSSCLALISRQARGRVAMSLVEFGVRVEKCIVIRDIMIG